MWPSPCRFCTVWYSKRRVVSISSMSLDDHVSVDVCSLLVPITRLFALNEMRTSQQAFSFVPLTARFDHIKTRHSCVAFPSPPFLGGGWLLLF